MRGISFLALLASNLAYWAIFAVTIWIAGAVALIVMVLASADSDTVQQAISILRSSEAYHWVETCLSYAAAAVGSGFVAARMSRVRPHFQAALALSSSTLLCLFGLYRGASVSTFAIVYLFAGPHFAVMGSYLAEQYQARIDAMPEQARAARTFKAVAVSALRWALAIPAAAVAFALSAAIAYRLIYFGPYALVIGVIAAILVGTYAAPPAHRRFAGFLLIGLALLVPAEEIVRNLVFGDLTNAHSVPILANTMAAGFAYIGLRKLFPQPFATDPGQWWWLLDLDLDQWSPEERNARRGLALSAGIIGIALFLVADALPYERLFILALRAVICLPIALMVARPLFGLIAPAVLESADRNAFARLESRHWRTNLH
jgi:hypothetical protein